MVLLKVILSLVAYLLGSIPTSLMIGKYFYKTDVRNFGSKNSGATNTLRVLGAKAAIPVLLGDVLKGYGATLLAYIVFSPGHYEFLHYKILFGAAAVVGHIYPFWANFRGGKGVATLTGVVFSLSPIAGLICMMLFILITYVSRYVSLASILTSFLLPFIFYFILKERDLYMIIFACSTFVLTAITHRSNILRLLAGQENRFSFQKKTQ